MSQLPVISGTVTDKNTGEAIQGAIIRDSLGKYYTYTNRNGYYSLGMNPGNYTLIVSAAGFTPSHFYESVYGLREKNIRLEPISPLKPDTQSNKAASVNDYRSGFTAPLVSQVLNMPAPVTEPDPVKFMQYLPGVSGGIEGLSGLYVRGGNADQNLVMMDGLPLYGSGHLFGFLSQFNPDQVRDMQFYRGSSPARYGGRAGAVLDVSMKDGNNKIWKGNYQADPLALKLNMDGPVNDKVTASIGLRRSWIDFFLPHQGGSYIFYNLHDLNAKVNWKINKNDQVSFWVYNGRDKFATKGTTTRTDSANRLISIKLEYSIIWQNTLAGVNYVHRFSPRLYANFTGGISRYAYRNHFNLEGTVTNDTGLDEAKIKFNTDNIITDYIAKADYEYNLLNGDYLRYGADLTLHQFKPSAQSLFLQSTGSGTSDSTYGTVNNQTAVEGSVYGEYEANLRPGLKANFGGRLWIFSGRDKTWYYPEPRIFISQMLDGNKALKLAFSISNQGVNQLSGVNSQLPSGTWFPSGINFTPQRNSQLSAGYSRPLKKGIEFSAEVFYKWMKGVTDATGRDEGDLLKNYWEKMLAQGKGTAYGFEALAMKKHGRFNGVAGYTWSYSNRTIPDINFGKTFPFRWDRRHKFSMTGVYHASRILTWNFALVIMTGNAVSVPTGKYVAADGTFIFNYSEKNNFRMPLYKRLDLGFSKQIHPERNREDKQYWGMNVYNILGFYNPLFINIHEDSNGVMKAYGEAYFTFVPSIFYKWVF